jgi:hypothetical protein
MNGTVRAFLYGAAILAVALMAPLISLVEKLVK